MFWVVCVVCMREVFNSLDGNFIIVGLIFMCLINLFIFIELGDFIVDV